MVRRNEVFENLIPDPKKPTLDVYYEKFKISFRRIWENKFLWFWGMFLPGSIGIGFNIEEQITKLKPDQISSWEVFIIENIASLIFLFVTALFFWFFLWFVSAIARSGVIQVLFCLQNPKNRKKVNCRKIWKLGKKNYKNILILDFFIGMFILIVFLIMLIPVFIMILTENQAGAIFLFITLLLFFFVFTVFMNYLLQIAIIYTVLAKLEISKSINLAFKLISRNIFEVVKLFSVFFLIGVLQGTVFLLLVTAVLPFWGSIVNVWFILYESSFTEWLLFSSAGMILLTMLFLFAKTIFSLWIQDIWLWWVKEISGNKIEIEEKELPTRGYFLELGMAVGVKSSVVNK